MKSVINEPLTGRDRQSSDEVLDRGLLKSLKRQTSQSSGKVQDDSGGVSWVSSFLTLPVPFYSLLGLQLLCSTTLPCLDLTGEACSVW